MLFTSLKEIQCYLRLDRELRNLGVGVFDVLCLVVEVLDGPLEDVPADVTEGHLPLLLLEGVPRPVKHGPDGPGHHGTISVEEKLLPVGGDKLYVVSGRVTHCLFVALFVDVVVSLFVCSLFFFS